MKWLWLVCMAVCIPGSVYAAEGVLYLSPERGVYPVGETFEINVLANTDGAMINAAEAELAFDPTSLAVERVSTDGSVLSAWPTPPSFSNESGTVRFSGWANDRFSGTDGLLVTVTFKALRNFSGSVRLVSGAMLAADNQGTNIITSMRSSTFAVEPASIVPPTPQLTDEATSTVSDSATTSAQEVSILQPVFRTYQSAINAGERVIVRGAAPADAHVSIWMQRGDEQARHFDTTSGPDGSFTFVSDEGVQAGTYSLWAQAIDQDGIRTATSTVITITANPAGLVASAGLTSAGSIYVLMAIAFGIAIGYLLHRVKDAG